MINKHRLGLVCGTFLGLWHFVWAGLVLTGFAQTIVNWILRLHFIQPFYIILPFNLGVAVALVLIAAASGYASGWILGAIWNWIRVEGSQPKSLSEMRRQVTSH